MRNKKIDKKTILVDDLEVVLTKKNIKNLNIRVKSDMRVYASCPFVMSEERVSEFIRHKRDWIDRNLAKMDEIRRAEEKKRLEKRDSRDIDKERMTLEALIQERLPIYEEMTGLYSSSWHIREMKTRWGSCNTRTRRLCFNLLLLRYPLECLDYVILHELVHIKVPNHSRDFWQIVERYMPDYREQRKKLNELIY